ncbi:MAG: hypothetical protein AAB836_00880 [Patescibacteria group bacterium]
MGEREYVLEYTRENMRGEVSEPDRKLLECKLKEREGTGFKSDHEAMIFARVEAANLLIPDLNKPELGPYRVKFRLLVNDVMVGEEELNRSSYGFEFASY